MSRLKIALLGDLHYGFPEDEDMEEYIEPVLKEMVEEINSFSPDIVVGMGDFIQHSNKEKDLERMEKVGEMLAKMRADFYAIPGNHDPMTISKEKMLEKLKPENDEPYDSLEIGERKLIFLDTIDQIDDIYGAGLLGEKQRKWLEGEMKTDKEVLIFSHHILHYRNLEGNWYFDEKPELAACIDKKNFHDIVGEKPRAVFSAHLHEAGLKEFKGLPHFTTSGMDKFNPPEQFEKNHALVDVNKNSIEVETFQDSFLF